MGLLGWSLAFLIIAVISALFGFGLIAGLSFTLAKWLFYIFVILFVILLIAHLARGKK